MAREDYEKGYAGGRRAVERDNKKGELTKWGDSVLEVIFGTGREGKSTVYKEGYKDGYKDGSKKQPLCS